MRSVLASVCLLVLVVGSHAADDVPESLRRAQAAVEKHRSDVDREKTRVVWPETVDETPPEGAEVLLIRGANGYSVHRLTWRDGRVDGIGAAPAAGTYVTSDIRRLGVSANDFVLAWNAARRVVDARSERIEPEPKDHRYGGSVLISSGRVEQWVRVRVGAEDPLWVEVDSVRREWDGVTAWPSVSDRAVFDVFQALLPKERWELVPEPVDALRDAMTEEVIGVTSCLELNPRSPDQILLTAALRVLGPAGDDAALEAVEALDRRLATVTGKWEHAVSALRRECGVARTRISLRLGWNEATARRILLDDPGSDRPQSLTSTVRGRWRECDVVGYARFLAEFATTELNQDAKRQTLEEFRREGGPELRRILHADLSSPVLAARTNAAVALLQVPDFEADATKTLEAVARDSSIDAPAPDGALRWPRRHAIAALVRHEIWREPELRERLADPRENGCAIAVVLSQLTVIGPSATDAEQIAAWRRALDVPGAGVLPAAEALLDARDLASLDRVAQALDAFEADPPAHIDVPTLNAALTDLRTKLDALR